MADIKKIDELARVGHEIIDLQFHFASKEPQRSLDDLWVLGYCFGVFDALGQRGKLDQYVDGISLISFGFALIMSNELEGADKVRHALDNQTHPFFVQGNHSGGTDIFNWLSCTAKAPMALCSYLRSHQ